jgi:hypothetical protein
MNELTKGCKFDEGKPRWNLLPTREIEEVVKVLTVGAEKYEDDNWKCVARSRERYFAAAMRHIIAWWHGEEQDTESGLHHLAHAICCLLFLMWFDHNGSPKFYEESEDDNDKSR